jgi:hypothetical protein
LIQHAGQLLDEFGLLFGEIFGFSLRRSVVVELDVFFGAD